MKRGSRNKIV